MDSGMPTIDPAFCDYCMATYVLGPCSWHESYRDTRDWADAVLRFRVRVLREGFWIYWRALAGKWA